MEMYKINKIPNLTRNDDYWVIKSTTCMQITKHAKQSRPLLSIGADTNGDYMCLWLVVRGL